MHAMVNQDSPLYTAALSKQPPISEEINAFSSSSTRVQHKSDTLSPYSIHVRYVQVQREGMILHVTYDHTQSSL